MASPPIQVTLTEDDVPTLRAAFLDSLALSHRSRHTLRDLYTGWIESVDAFRAARVTGTFTLPASADQASERRSDLAEYDRIAADLARLRGQLARESQMRRRVELNAKIRQLRSEYASIRDRL